MKTQLLLKYGVCLGVCRDISSSLDSIEDFLSKFPFVGSFEC